MSKTNPRGSGSFHALMGVVLCALLLAACRGMDPPRDLPPVLRVALLPDQAEATLRAHYEPLLAHLSSATGLDVELYVPETYAELLDGFDAGEFELAWFGGLTFSQAQLRSGAEPLVSRDVDVRFTTVFVAASDEGDSVEAFAGQSLAFGPRLSTSGHLMAREYLEARGLRPESLFAEVRHSRGHDQTMAWVLDGVVAIGAVNQQIAEAAFRAGRFSADELRIVATTPPYQNYVWATPESLDPQVRRALLEAFLALDPAVPEHSALLTPLGAGGFVPVGPEAYASLQRIARKVGLLETERSGDRS